MQVVRSADVDFEPASHEDPSNPGVLKKVMARASQLIAGQVQMINWAELPVGRSFARHYHEDMQEIFIITEGRVRMHVGTEEAELQSGDLVLVPPRAEHQMSNLGDAAARYIVFGISVWGRWGRRSSCRNRWTVGKA